MPTPKEPLLALTFLTQQSRPSKLFWFSVSLVFAVVYGLLAIQQAFNSDYVVQDDARQHIFWMQRYLDPELFPDDLIADYFQTAAPIGYSWLYQVMALFGVEPDFFSKILPFFLGLIAAGYCFWVCLEIVPMPLAGFLSSVILSQNLWCSDELSSATPRAFLYPLIFAFLYYLLRQAHWICLILIGLQVIFYPHISLISLGVVTIRLVHWQDGRIIFSKNWKDYLLLSTGLCFILGLVLYTKSLSEFGPLVTRLEAENLPEFQPGGRNVFFKTGLDYWLGGRSGIFHRRTLIPATLGAGILLPFLLWLPLKTSIRKRITPNIFILLHLLIVSFGLFFLAHLLLFQLHLPNRYTGHTIRVILAIASGLSWMIILDDIFRLFRALKHRASQGQGKSIVHRLIPTAGATLPLVSTAAIFTVICFYYPLLIGNFPKASYYDFTGERPIYEFFATQPKDILIASLADEASNIPTFSARSVVVSREHSLAYHRGYYRQFQQRVEELIRAQYSDNPAVLSAFIETYDIDFWLLDEPAFQAAYVAGDRWINQFQPAANDAALRLQQGTLPILQQSVDSCTVLQADDSLVLSADCIHGFATAQNAASNDAPVQ